MLSDKSEKEKIDVIDVYQNTSFPGYYDEGVDSFLDNWTPRITLSSGNNNDPAYYEAWKISKKNTPRYLSVTDDYGLIVLNPNDMASNYEKVILIRDNLPYNNLPGVCSMSDIFIYSNGLGSELFKKNF
ncbi:hypothetical protein BJ944DRAFT_233573 [Cunninghamella echinulata]|nr:hypothetical protein BJ944DRAFT_233573 [Cunninghamella echinulata]